MPSSSGGPAPDRTPYHPRPCPLLVGYPHSARRQPWPRRTASIPQSESPGWATAPTTSSSGPSSVGEVPEPAGGFKDTQCRVKRQAARFRIFAHHDDGTHSARSPTPRPTSTWTVHLVNAKAAHPGRGNSEPAGDLTIDPGPRTLTGPDQRQLFDDGHHLVRRAPDGHRPPRRDPQRRRRPPARARRPRPRRPHRPATWWASSGGTRAGTTTSRTAPSRRRSRCTRTGRRPPSRAPGCS